MLLAPMAGCTTIRPCRLSATCPPMMTSCSSRRPRRGVDRDGKVGLCILDQPWPVGYLQDDHPLPALCHFRDSAGASASARAWGGLADRDRGVDGSGSVLR